jgi:hypothetical protein
MPVPYVALGVRLYAFVQLPKYGWAPISVTSFQCDYTINQIPQATIEAPLGMTRDYLISTAHVLSGNLFRIPIVVVASVDYGFGSPGTLGLLLDHPLAYPKVFLLFSGYVTKVTVIRREKGAFASLSCVHWLSQLDFSSGISSIIHPNNPAHLTFPAFYKTGAGGFLGGGARGFSPLEVVQGLLTPEQVKYNLWKYGIYRWLAFLAATDAAYFAQPYVLNALNSIFPMMYGITSKSPVPRLVDALQLRTDYPDALRIIANITDSLAGRTTNHTKNDLLNITSLAENTIWSKLVNELSPELQFVICPLPGYARVIPYNPVLAPFKFLPDVKFYDINWYVPFRYSKVISFTIRTDQIFSTTETSAAQIPIKVFGLYGNYAPLAGSHLEVNNSLQSFIGGYYAAPEITAGQIVLEKAPFFLSISSVPSVYLGQMISFNRATMRNLPAAIQTNNEIALAGLAEQTILDRMAKFLYAKKLTEHRQLEIAGPLRFDVCPGSTIAVEAVGSNYLPGSFAIDTAVIGYVYSVGYDIDLNRQNTPARTIFRLTNLRNIFENIHTISFTARRHPLYEYSFIGGTMENQLY